MDQSLRALCLQFQEEIQRCVQPFLFQQHVLICHSVISDNTTSGGGGHMCRNCFNFTQKWLRKLGTMWLERQSYIEVFKSSTCSETLYLLRDNRLAFTFLFIPIDSFFPFDRICAHHNRKLLAVKTTITRKTTISWEHRIQIIYTGLHLWKDFGSLSESRKIRADSVSYLSVAVFQVYCFC